MPLHRNLGRKVRPLVSASMSDALQHHIAAAVDRYLATAPDAPAACVAIDAPAGAFAVSRGLADPATGEAMTADHAVRIASCTKTFVAASVLQLAADGALHLDQPALAVAPPAAGELLQRFEHGHTITIRQLLQHRSGMVDHNSFPASLQGPSFEWTALAQLAIAVEQPALFAPGTAYSYSDSGYILLGQIVEGLTGDTLAGAVRRHTRLDELDVSSIHWERVEPTPAGLRSAHQFHDGPTADDWNDTLDWNPTLDLFGGGGMVATMPDMATWWTALFEGRAHPHLAQQLADPQPAIGPDGVDTGDEVGLGIFRHHVDGAAVWSHGGYWGLRTFHVPAVQTSVALVVTAKGANVPAPRLLADDIVRALVA